MDRFKQGERARRHIFITAIALTGALANARPASAEMEGYVVHPIWTRRPSTEDLERLYPKRVHGVTADVSVDCLIDQSGRFTTCEIVGENPGNLGFGESTVKLSRLFRMKAVDADGAPVAGRKLRLPVRWWAGLGR
jgi:hypothetical protein